MLPMIMATLLRSSPKAAVNIERIIIRKKSWLGVLPLIKRSTASDLSLLVRVLKSINIAI